LFALFVRFDLRPGAGESFDALVADLLPLVRQHEPGTVAYVCTRDAKAPDTGRLFFEAYRDRNAFEEHERQPHVKRFLAERVPLIAFLRVELADSYAAAGVN
jgi:quinol monooxygenase YgiN